MTIKCNVVCVIPIMQLRAYANVNILRGTFRPEEIDVEEEAPSNTPRSTLTPAVWKKPAFPKKLRRRRQRRKYIRQLQETARNLSNAHCTKEYSRSGSKPSRDAHAVGRGGVAAPPINFDC